MVLDFSKLSSGGNTADTIVDPQKIFHALPSKDRRYQYLRDVQGEVLTNWNKRRNESDLVIKMNTGGGKTVVGLLALKSCLNEGYGPAIYIAPDKYLVLQVIREAEDLGIDVVDNIDHPRFLQGKAIFVTNIHKLINGRSKFGVGQEGIKVEIGSILIDDAHACIATAENQFALTIPQSHKVFNKLIQLFSNELKTQSLTDAVALEQGDPYALARLPYWAWQAKQENVIRILSEMYGDSSYDFVWPLIKDQLQFCVCIFSGRRIEISPPCLPIHTIPSFTNAKRRIYMTATMADDGVLISDFDADPNSVQRPITPKTASDIGDRMILIPQELNPETSDEVIREFVIDLSSKHNTVVIVPSFERAKFWENATQEILEAENVHEGVEKLRRGHVGLVVMVNRYDGIDLPGDACRILVIDGLPDVRRLKDKIEQTALAGSEVYKSRQMQRIEQGIGRGIRSNEDYCAVLLMGARLTQILNSPGAIKHLTPATHSQLTLSKRVAEQIEGKGLDAVKQVIEMVIEREPQWVSTAKNALIDLQYETSGNGEKVIIIHERKAFDAACRGRYEEAANDIQVAIDVASNNYHKAWLMQSKAEYLHPVNAVDSQRILASASQESPYTLKPMEGIQYKRIEAQGLDQARQCAEFLFQKYKNANDLIITVNGLLAKLVYGLDDSYKDFENAMEELGRHLGFTVQRPEQMYNAGPDVLWAIGERQYILIACKNEANADVIFKRYANEISGDVNWFKSEYDQSCSCVPVVAHKFALFDKTASPPENTRVLTQEKKDELEQTVRTFVQSVKDKRDDMQVIREALKQHNLLGNSIVEHYFVPYKKKLQ